MSENGEGAAAKRKTHTSTQVKARYNAKTYSQWIAPIRKEEFERIEALRGDMSRAAFLRMLVDRYASDLEEQRQT